MDRLHEHTCIYLDGAIIKAADAGLHLYEDALYGYGAYEGIRAYGTHNGIRMFKAEAHFERLENSCRQLDIPYLWDHAQLIRDIYRLLEANNLRNAYIRPLVFSSQAYEPESAGESHILITAMEWMPYPGHNLIRVALSDCQHPQRASVAAKVIGQQATGILAARRAAASGFQDVLLRDREDYVAQATQANLFIEKHARLYTPPEGHIMPGITRSTVMEICKSLRIEVTEQPLLPEDLYTADSAFLCGTAAGIMGIAAVDNHLLPESWPETLGATIQRMYKTLALETENYEVII